MFGHGCDVTCAHEKAGFVREADFVGAIKIVRNDRFTGGKGLR